MEILIISGLSGGGKSKAASFLEDMGFYIVDNMPAGMIMKFAEFCAAGNGRYSRVALVYDVRTADTFDEFLEVLNTLRQQKYNCRLLFLEAEVDAIIKRYKETRRLHPLQEQTGSLEAAVNQEIGMMAPVRAQADVVINSTKSMIGHLLGAAGGVEFIACVKSIQDGFIHQTVGTSETDPECDLNYAVGAPVEKDVNYVLTNSLGFGGHNATLLLKKYI